MTRQDAQRPQSRAAEQGEKKNMITEYFGWGRNAKTAHKCRKSKVLLMDGPTYGWMDLPTDKGTRPSPISRVRDLQIDLK